jgi:hypothetical protein
MSVLPRIALFLQYVLPRNSRNTQNLLAVCSPTEFTEYTEPSCSMFSHRLHRFSQNLLAVYSPTEFTEYTEPSCCIFSHGLHRFSQMLLSWCTCLSVSICEICGRILSATSSVNSVNSVGEYLGRVISVGELPVNLLLAMLAQIGVALREVVVAEPPATVGRQR